MRIDRLDLTAFGVFTNATIDLSHGNFHIIHGPNAVGKSTARSALSNFLYGFGRSSTYAFLHPLNRLQVGGLVTDKDGKSLDVIRYKKDRSDLVSATTGAEVTAGDWSTFLQGVSKEDFERIYTIGWNELLEGTAALVSGGGAIGEALFASGLGINDIRSVLEQLDTQAGKLFAPKAQKLTVNGALKAAEAARKEAVAHSVRPAKFDTTSRDHQKAIAKRRKLASQRVSADSAIERLTTIRGVLPQLRKKSQFLIEKFEIESSGSVAPAPWAIRVNEALTARTEAAREKSEAQQRGSFASEKLKDLTSDPIGLSIADDVDSLAEGIKGYSQGLSDRAGLNQGRLNAEKSALNVLQGIIVESDAPDDLGSVQPFLRNRKALISARDRWSKEENALMLAATALTTVEQELSDTASELDKLGESVNVETLRSTLHAISRKGDLDAALKTARSRVETARAALITAAGEIGISEEKIGSIFAQPLPSEVEVEEILGAIELLLNRATTDDEHIETLNTRISELEDGLSALELDGELPTEEELTMRREHRSVLWNVINGSWLRNETISPTIDYTDAPTLASAFERSIGNSDEAADEMWRHADRTAARSNFQLQLRREQEDRALAQSSAIDSRKGASDVYSKFKEGWKKQPLPDDSSFLRSWSRNVQDLSAQFAEWNEARLAHRSAFRESRSASQQLRHQLKEMGVETNQIGLEIDSYLELTVEFLKTSDETNASRKSLLATLSLKQRRVPGLEGALEGAIESERNAADKFHSLCNPYGSDVETSADAGIFITRVDDLEEQISIINERSGRITGIDERSRRFELEAQRLIDAVAGPPIVDFLADARSLVARVKIARQTDAAREPLLATEASARGEVETADAALSGVEQELLVLASEQGVTDIEVLGELAVRALKLAELNDEVALCEEMLSQQGGGMSIAFLEEESKEMDFAAIDAEISRWQDERSRLAEDEAEAEIGERELDALLRQMDGSDKAARYLSEAQFELEKAKEGANEFLKLSLAKLLADEAVRRFAEAHQDPVLDRASQYLEILTAGKYRTVGVSNDSKDMAVLGAIDNDHQEWHIGKLSSGIRDSLYLALRFAALEAANQKTGPMPVVLDDVLVNLDEEHSSAVLNCLYEIATNSEVLLFTHHAHVVDLAESLFSKDQLSIHHLG